VAGGFVPILDTDQILAEGPEMAVTPGGGRENTAA